MTVRLRGVAVLTAVLLALTGCGSSGRSATPTDPKALPGVTLRSFTGGTSLDLAGLRGPTVVNVWASWCGPCRRELPLYESFAREHAGKVDVLGIDFQDTRKDKARQLIRRTGVTFPLYEDPDGLLRSRVLPQIILVDASGRVTHAEYVEITSAAQLEKLVAKHLGVDL